MKKDLILAISTCPNDTFIFSPMILNFIEHPYNFKTLLDDVEVLNNLAIAGIPDIVKVSYGVLPKIIDKYTVLKSGGALSFGYGPVVVSKNYYNINELYGKKIAVPGFNTTAFNIFKRFYGDNFDFIQLRFDKIIPAILDDNVDAGLLIHEGRFVYKNYGLNLLSDLGEEWDKKYSAPIPLGAIVVRREILDMANNINNIIKNSILYSKNNMQLVYPFIKKYAQELDDEVLEKHISAFVNENSFDMSKYIDVIVDFLGVSEKDFV
ncbi:1,4-dihydroxy-6-naphthoate synthase [Deferribacter thermophilus]|uniref:1,4-dihydroxy-6-naphthoate synthase n=1 Tax=Deferribacter thermophilus TaxID=53573 RepID=UPI003C1751E6